MLIIEDAIFAFDNALASKFSVHFLLYTKTIYLFGTV